MLFSIWWRWIYLPPTALDLVEVTTEENTFVHPLDEILQKNLPYLTSSKTFLNQFRRATQTISIGELWVDKCEVNQGKFRRFAHWRAAQVLPPSVHPKQPKNWTFQSQSQDNKILGQLTVPAGGLSFFDAWAYCNAAGGRLPKSDEYEAISSGPQKRIYPWGNVFINSAWKYKDPSLNIAETCSAHPETSTPEGIHDLGNNLSEWTIDDKQPVLMGGNAYNRPYSLHSLNLIRRRAPHDFRSQFTGFRCVYDRNPTAQIETLPLPWGGDSKVATINAQNVEIGPPDKSRLAALFRYLENDQTKSIEQFPIKHTSINLKIMRYEVTTELYARFLRDPLIHLGFYNHSQQPLNIDHTPLNWEEQKKFSNQPVTQISWWSAWSFATWAKGRLPSAEEWQALAGANLTKYPYGNEYVSGLSVDRNSVADHKWLPQNVLASKDASKHTIQGFAGNVSEWTNTSILRGNSFNLIIKGGSFLMPEEGGNITQIGEAPPEYKGIDLGFRVVFPIKSN